MEVATTVNAVNFVYKVSLEVMFLNVPRYLAKCMRKCSKYQFLLISAKQCRLADILIHFFPSFFT